MSVGILQQCLGDFSKCKGISDLSVSLSSCFHGNVPWWGRCTKTDPPASACLTLPTVEQATTVVSASSILLQKMRVNWKNDERSGQFPAIFSSSRSTDFYKPGTISFSWGSALTLDFNNKSSLEACSTGLCGKFAIASSPWQLDWSSGTLAKIHKSTLALDSHLFQWDSGREMPLWIWAFIPKILKIWGSLFSTHCPQRLWVIPFVKTNHSFTLLIYKLMELMGT